MTERQLVLVSLTAVVVLGMVAQWLAWRLRLPAILLLLLFGFSAGPLPELLTHDHHKWLNPDDLLGKLLYPLISLSVAIILFEGGLTLSIHDLRQVGRVLRNLVTIGALIAWIATLLAAHFILGMSWPLAVLLGAILIVTGPTVIGPLLRHVKPVGQVGPILKWEGIVIDPIGATLALLVFEAVAEPGMTHAAARVGMSLVGTLLAGSSVGLGATAFLVLVFRRFWVADYLQNPVALMFVLAAFTASNLLKEESGLLAVTVMGVVLANQRFVPFKHVLEFKESLSILLVSSLFILLGSRLSFSQFSGLGWPIVGFLAVLFLVARPLSVLASSVRSSLSWKERLFLSWMAPRGIVAAAVASVFALRLRQANVAGAERIVPVTFAVIISTVLVYGLTASLVAGRLGLASKGQTGYLVAGANPLARAIAKLLQSEGRQVALVDTNRPNVATARLDGLNALPMSINSEAVVERIEGTGISRLLALTPNEEVNSLAAVHFARVFGRSQVFQLAPEPRPAQERVKDKVSHELRGRLLFGPGVTYETLAERLESGGVLKKTAFTPTFGMPEFRKVYGDDFVPMFLITETGEWVVSTAADPIAPRPGQTMISLVKPSTSPENRAPEPEKPAVLA